MRANEIIGKKVRYYDYLDCERDGTIIDLEISQNGICYVYISDSDEDYNIHEDVVNGRLIRYAELRNSEDVYLM